MMLPKLKSRPTQSAILGADSFRQKTTNATVSFCNDGWLLGTMRHPSFTRNSVGETAPLQREFLPCNPALQCNCRSDLNLVDSLEHAETPFI